jgi:hypothetical protein
MSYVQRWYGLPSNYDDWKTKSPWDDEVIVSYCLHCGGEIYEGSEEYKVNGDWVHEDCFSDWAKEVLDARLKTAEQE